MIDATIQSQTFHFLVSFLCYKSFIFYWIIPLSIPKTVSLTLLPLPPKCPYLNTLYRKTYWNGCLHYLPMVSLTLILFSTHHIIFLFHWFTKASLVNVTNDLHNAESNGQSSFLILFHTGNQFLLFDTCSSKFPKTIFLLSFLQLHWSLLSFSAFFVVPLCPSNFSYWSTLGLHP